MKDFRNPSNGGTQFPPTADSALRGLKWKAVINGRKCINGARYSATITGEIESSEEWSTIYDVMHDLAEHLEANNGEMELPDSFQITLYPPTIKVTHDDRAKRH